MAHFENKQTKETYPLKPNEPVTLGRNKYGLKGRYCSREHVKISLLENGRCFLEKLTDHATLLNSVHLPQRREVEAFDGDTITIGAEQKIILRLPNSKEPVYHITVCEDEPLNVKEEVRDKVENSEDSEKNEAESEAEIESEISDESSLLGDYE